MYRQVDVTEYEGVTMFTRSVMKRISQVDQVSQLDQVLGGKESGEGENGKFV